MKQIIALLLVVLTFNVYANEAVTQEQQLREQHLLRETLAIHVKKKTPRAVSKTCMTVPLPSTPKSPHYTISYTGYDDSIKLIFWRESCKYSSKVALLVRAIPVQGNPFFCSPNFKIIQNGEQLNDIKIQSSSDSYSSWCDDLLIPSTAIVNQYELGETQFDPKKDLTVFYEDQLVDIPAASGVTTTNSKRVINGTTSGYMNYRLTCKNTKSGVVKKFLLQTITDWSCEGLSIKAGDTVQTTITGVVR